MTSAIPLPPPSFACPVMSPAFLHVQELLTARRKVKQDAASRLQAAQQKRARAEARRVRHFEQLGEARRAAAVAKAEAEVSESH